MKLQPFPILETERLTLRNIRVSDSEAILFLRSDKTINKFIDRPENRKTKSLADAVKFIKELAVNVAQDKAIVWGITSKEDTKIIGTICLWNFSEDAKNAEVGYNLDPVFHHKGIMTEAMKVVVGFGFNELKFDKIEAFTHKENEASKSLLEKNGFYLTDRTDDDNANNIVFECVKRAR